MTQKKCPYCGEYVQKNNLTCPRCFREIPREPTPNVRERTADGNKKGLFGKIPAAAVFLAVFPAFIGLLGLGLIYLHPKDKKGYWFLVAGLVLFWGFLALFLKMLNSGFLSAILLFVVLVIFLLIYISAAIGAFIETTFGSIFKVLRF
ncbi:MAG: hypothetical protein FWG60_03460 [Methanomassiliicoccaceae archaeon]|nr:hypothetical protein [Methanomassiliicoccaceae archaeon]